MLVLRAKSTPPEEPWPPPGFTPADIPPAEGQLAISQDCERQFADRTVFATCTHRIDETDRRFERHAIGVVTHYSGSVYTTDAWMTQCMREGGTWWRMDENDSRAEIARAEYDLAASRAQLERLRGRR
jgi:hypothetical protein